MIGCEFCELYEWKKNENKKFDKEHEGIHSHTSVKLYEYKTRNRRRCASTTYKAMKLKYCPMCGRKLSE